MTTRQQDTPERLLTTDDLEHFPDDGRRYELADGRLDVSPAPKPLHTRASYRLGFHLGLSSGGEFEIHESPGIDLNGDRTRHRLPDLAVFDVPLPESGYFSVPPLLAVEVVSPDSVLRDNHTKRIEYAAFGVPAYWVINPLADKVGLVELRLEGGQYREVVQAHGEDVFATDFPFALSLVPHWLTADGPWLKNIGGGTGEE
ncbi:MULTISPECIES: Uma2 family endonuclease [unclassified Nocardiopsis]|uniref:Uma2 family endonuclease n=1 Tax=Nocardiopsis TaxID=2013 RepID=UPI00387B8959